MMERPHIWLTSFVSDLSLIAEIFAKERMAKVIFSRDRMIIISGEENDELSLTVYPEMFLEYMAMTPTYLEFNSVGLGYDLRGLDKNEIVSIWHRKNAKDICWYTAGDTECYLIYNAVYNFDFKPSVSITPSFEVLVNSDAFKYVILRLVSDQIVKFEYDGTILRVGKTWIYAMKVIKPQLITFYVPRMNLHRIIHFKLPEYITLAVVGNKLIIKVVETDIIGKPYYELTYTTIINEGRINL